MALQVKQVRSRTEVPFILDVASDRGKKRLSPAREDALSRLSIPKSGPLSIAADQSIIRGQQISEAVKAERELADAKQDGCFIIETCSEGAEEEE
ncbi:MAG: hypothetical protein EZS28_054130 [Streblomastix strix]|uniref:Uncharacterized protein n=1 Tax=Streblomastix strix TaxID=222440 RepID=A0A5J4QUV6_9EUKA|nr:MAG: hypothetical protein EZS28_054130 [Streblomastix strix]